MLIPSSKLPALFSVLALLASGAQVYAQDKDLPKAEDVLDKFIEVTGGKAAYEKLKNRQAKGTLEITNQNIKAKIEITQEAPNKQVSVTEIEGFGSIKQGTDGKVAWSSDPSTGDRIMEGEEKDGFIKDAELHGEANWREKYAKVETVGSEEIGGKPCWKLVLTPKEGSPATAYYEKESGLLAKLSQSKKSVNGEFQVEATPSDYREVDGIKMPFTNVEVIVGFAEVKVTLDEVKHNVELPKETFDLPEAIKKLQESK
jgi:hypothetical protein